MYTKLLHSITFISIVLSVANGAIDPVCDVEGSGIDDCSSEQYCCEQSECDKLYNSDVDVENQIDVEYDNEIKLRCCDIIEVNVTPLPSDCRLCTQCCDDADRLQVPLPGHCSKCPKCTRITLATRNNKSGK